jgi:hypothetical protein
MITKSAITSNESYATFRNSYGDLLDAKTFYILKGLQNSEEFDKKLKQVNDDIKLLQKLGDIESGGIELDLQLAHKNNMSWDLFELAFPQSAKYYGYAQYMRCIACPKFETCIYDHKCINQNQYQTSSTCVKAVNGFLEQIEQYKTSLSEYSEKMAEWMRELDEIKIIRAYPNHILKTSSINYFTTQRMAYTIQQLGYNPSVWKLDEWIKIGEEIRLFENVSSYKMILKKDEAYLENQLKIHALRKPELPQPPSNININCIECSNKVDLSNINTISNSQIKVVAQCIIENSEKERLKQQSELEKMQEAETNKRNEEDKKLAKLNKVIIDASDNDKPVQKTNYTSIILGAGVIGGLILLSKL